MFSGDEREYQLNVPVRSDPTRPSPLILNIHGFTSNIDEQDAISGLATLGGARGYVVVTPQGEARTDGVASPTGIPQWNVALDASGSTDDVHFLLDLVVAVETDICIDTSRVFVPASPMEPR